MLHSCSCNSIQEPIKYLGWVQTFKLNLNNFVGTNKLNAPTKVNVNTYLRSIDKIDDYKMVFVKVVINPNFI